LGYDHIEENDRIEMRELEDKIMQELNLEVKRWSAEPLPL
jgi:ssRNA-specific RNase YbeY (16S rRNA maturation enzyme)